MIKSLASLIAMSGAFSLFFLPSPHAATPTYLDPGTGSMILQVLIGFLVGGLLMLKIFWGRISTWVKNLFSREEKLEEQEKPKR